jgi:hypothetical protein
MDDHSSDNAQRPESSRIWRTGLVLFGFLVIGGVLLISEHRIHLLGALIYLPLLLCPLMHFFLHRHGSHGPHDRRPS